MWEVQTRNEFLIWVIGWMVGHSPRSVQQAMQMGEIRCKLSSDRVKKMEESVRHPSVQHFQ